MKPLKYIAIILFFAFNIVASHPSIYTSDEDKSYVEDKIKDNQWAAKNYAAIKSQVEVYVERHKSDPEWIVSRLQMYWKGQYADVYVNGSVFSHGEGDAGVPTPKFAGGRDWAVDYISPSTEDIQPYSDDDRGMWLRNGKKEGKLWEWAPLDKTGQIIERINERIMGLAEKAAFVYWFTGDEDYAKFAADIFWTYTNGMYHRGNPKFYKDDRSKGIIGLATFEVIHEAITIPMAVCYDYIYDYLVAEGKDVKVAQEVFRRWSDRIIEGGGSEGNWNLNQARHIVYMGLALEDNDAYSDGKGKQYYIDSFLKIRYPNQKPLKELINDQYDPDQAIWPEAPGYAFGVTETILKLSHIIREATGNDVLAQYPIIEKAYLAYFQYLFPSGVSVGFGDTYHDRPQAEPLELLASLYHSRGDDKMEVAICGVLQEQVDNGYNRAKNNTIMSLTSYVDKLKVSSGDKPTLQTPTYYSRPINMFMQRNGEDAKTALAATLTGTAGGHVHANGMAMELYGLGMVMAPDAGRGTSYWQKEQGEYYMRFPAHNTVVVDGISDYDPHRIQNDNDRIVAYRVNSCEPVCESKQRLNDKVSFIDASFVEPKTNADQRRQVAIIRTSPESGYYVDVFRSAKRDGSDKFHDYIYHNIGKIANVSNNAGKEIKFKKTNFLSSKRGLLKGYDYFKNEKGSIYKDDFNVVFDTGHNASMKMWTAGFHGTTLFTVDAPISRAAARGAIPTDLRDKPLPTVIVRRNGAAWKKPFINVYEPFVTNKGASIERINNISEDDGLVAIEVVGKYGKQFILGSDSEYRRFKIENIEFEGSFAVISFDRDGKLEYLYLGNGRFLSAGGYSLDSAEDIVSAGVNLNNGEIELSNNKPVRLTVPAKNKQTIINAVKDGSKIALGTIYFDDGGEFRVSARIEAGFDTIIEINL